MAYRDQKKMAYSDQRSSRKQSKLPKMVKSSQEEGRDSNSGLKRPKNSQNGRKWPEVRKWPKVAKTARSGKKRLANDNQKITKVAKNIQDLPTLNLSLDLKSRWVTLRR